MTTPKTIAIVNGPNLNLTGIREPEIYGNLSFDDYLKQLRLSFPEVEILYFQSNVEGEIINFLQSCMGKVAGILCNAGGYTHTSVAIADCIAAIQIPVIEIHISHVLAREEFRKHSFMASKCIGTISGLGMEGYRLGIAYFLSKFKS
jgi:3-dehydroquinate dehydratase-2